MSRQRQVLMALFAVVLFVVCAVPLMAQQPEVELPIQCRGDVCVIPKAALVALMEAHNYHVEEIRRLEKGCPKFKKERDA